MLLDKPINVADLPIANYDNSPVPEGEYTATIPSAEVKQTKAGTGQFVNVRFDITGPTHAGRVIFGKFNIRNPNPKAEEIGRAQLGELGRAIGVAKITDTDQFIGGQVKIKVTIRKSEEYGDQNEIKRFMAIEGAQMPAPEPEKFVKEAQPAPAASGSTPPWKKPPF